MLRRVLASSRYVMLIASFGAFVGALVLIFYEAIVLGWAIVDIVRAGSATPKAVKSFAIELIEGVDVFLIAIAMYIIGQGLYALFVDDTLPLPRWLEVHNLEDLKGNLVSIVIAVLAVIFLREAVVWEPGRDLPAFGIALAFVVAALTFFLTWHGSKKE